MTVSNDAYSAIEKLDATHEVDAFDCGKEPLDQFLKRYALVNLKAGSAQTYVVCREGRRVVGYYSLTYGAFEAAAAMALARIAGAHRVRFVPAGSTAATALAAGRDRNSRSDRGWEARHHRPK